MQEDNVIDLYERYFYEKLSPSERVAFRQRLKTDLTFKAGYLRFVDTVRMITTTDLNLDIESDDKITIMRNRFHRKIANDNETNIYKLSPRRNWQKLAVAATILLLFTTATWFLLPFSVDQVEAYHIGNMQNSSKVLIEKINPAGYTPIATRTPLISGLQHFSEKEYILAINDFSTYINDSDTTAIDIAYVYKGESQRRLGQLTEAVETLSLASDRSEIYNEKYFSLGLIYQELNQNTAARRAYERVVRSNNGIYRDQANHQLDKLE